MCRLALMHVRCSPGGKLPPGIALRITLRLAACTCRSKPRDAAERYLATAYTSAALASPLLCSSEQTNAVGNAEKTISHTTPRRDWAKLTYQNPSKRPDLAHDGRVMTDASPLSL